MVLLNDGFRELLQLLKIKSHISSIYRFIY